MDIYKKIDTAIEEKNYLALQGIARDVINLQSQALHYDLLAQIYHHLYELHVNDSKNLQLDKWKASDLKLAIEYSNKAINLEENSEKITRYQVNQTGIYVDKLEYQVEGTWINIEVPIR